MVADGRDHRLNERAQYLFKCLVDRYIADGQPVGSRTLARDARLELSPATIRNVMADLEDMGLIKAPHTSAGRIPTVSGYRLFVDTLLTYKEPAVEEMRSMAEQLESMDDVQQLLRTTSEMLSRITNMAGLVMIPRTDARSLRQLEFLRIRDNRVLAILVLNDGEVQNRVIQTRRLYTDAELTQAANYLGTAFVGKDIEAVKNDLLKELRVTHEEMNRMMQAVVEMTQKVFGPRDVEAGYVLAGQTNLMGANLIPDMDRLRQLFEAFNRQQDILHLLDQALEARGVQIFIGEESGYDVLDACSLVTAPYNNDNRLVGVLGVIGPTRMEYERVVPIVSLTARMFSSALKSFS